MLTRVFGGTGRDDGGRSGRVKSSHAPCARMACGEDAVSEPGETIEAFEENDGHDAIDLEDGGRVSSINPDSDI